MAKIWHFFGKIMACFLYKMCYALIMRNLTYDLFVEKFKRKLTTDDCYTPENVYNAVLDWCVEEYDVDKNKVLRPFWPDKDYTQYDYSLDCVVIDNPPFSILAEIVKFYLYLGIKFFLFAPDKTIFSLGCYPCCLICIGANIIFENGASVGCSFITNLEDAGVRSAPELYRRIKEVQENQNSLPKYQYPNEVLTFSTVGKFSKYGIDFKVKSKDLYFIRTLDSQKQYKKNIFGAGFLMSQQATQKRIEAEEKVNKINPVQE